MSDEIRSLMERQSDFEARLAGLERASEETAGELRRFLHLLRGNGEDGFFGQVRLNEERVEFVMRLVKWILWILAGLLAALISAIVAGCGFVRDPSERIAHELQRPDGTVVRCHEPPADVVPAAVRAEVDARIPDIVDLVNARVGVEEAFARIRSECPTLQAVEALEFRMCAAWAQGALDEEAYGEFLTRILPLLRSACAGAEGEGNSEERTEEPRGEKSSSKNQ